MTYVTSVNAGNGTIDMARLCLVGACELELVREVSELVGSGEQVHICV